MKKMRFYSLELAKLNQIKLFQIKYFPKFHFQF